MHEPSESEDTIRQAIMAVGGFTKVAETIDVTQGHLSNAVSGRDGLSGGKVLLLWHAVGKAFDLELGLARLTDSRRRTEP